MRRVDLSLGVRQIVDAINESNLIKQLEAHINTVQRRTGTQKMNENGINSQLLSALNKWALLEAAFSPSARKVAAILNLQELRDASGWSPLISLSTPALAEIYQIRQSLSFTHDFLPDLLKLIENQSTNVGGPARNSDNDELGPMTFSVVAVDDTGESLSPQRLIAMTESTQKLYGICATLNDLAPSDLRVVAADSGSDVALTFLGNPVVVTCLVGVFAGIYKAILFFPELKKVEKAKAISEQLSVLTEINQREETGKISHEEAGRLRHDLGVATDEFVSARAYVPEAQVKGALPLRTLMSSEPKLLTGSPEDVAAKTPTQSATASPPRSSRSGARKQDRISRDEKLSANDADFTNMTDEQKKLLRQMFKQMGLAPDEDDVKPADTNSVGLEDIDGEYSDMTDEDDPGAL